MKPVHLCVCLCVCVSVCGWLCMGSHHLSRGSAQQSLSAKSAECEAWCQMTNLRDKLHLKETFFIVCPSPLQLFPFIQLPISSSPKSTHLSVIHCAWWALFNYSIYSNIKGEYNKIASIIASTICCFIFDLLHWLDKFHPCSNSATANVIAFMKNKLKPLCYNQLGNIRKKYCDSPEEMVVCWKQKCGDNFDVAGAQHDFTADNLLTVQK